MRSIHVAELHPNAADLEVFQLITRAQDGDLDACGDLYRHYYLAIVKFHMNAVQHPYDARDLTSVTFATMLLRLPGFRFDEGKRRSRYFASKAFGGWLMSIARLDQVRYFGRGRTVPEAPFEVRRVTKAKWHRLSNVNLETMTASCSLCGPESSLSPVKDRDPRCKAGMLEVEARRREKRRERRAQGLPRNRPLEERPARSIVAIPVSQDWVFDRCISATEGFHDANEDHPFWIALNASVQASIDRRRRANFRPSRLGASHAG